MNFTKHKSKIVYEKVLVVEKFTEKGMKIQINFREFDCLIEYSGLFLCVV